ncbi:hypothetical protein [Beijerinckia sp. L45]|uniref:hypothetical protein n=1 Tax=Beijerinckia sp. L45 TaxID=1641855 RepID=UPI00131D8392|nr:hypothetical protein [Beijerinckia sp. L45]
MTSNLKLAAALCLLFLVVAGSALVYRNTRPPSATSADPATVLSATKAEDEGTEPVALPATPVLKNAAADPGLLDVAFGYKVGSTAYAYHLALAFAPDADKGSMTLATPQSQPVDAVTFPVERHFSESRKAYLIAVSRDLGTMTPAVPSLCVRAVVGPSKTGFDLTDASLCVMQRDQDGRCHPTTLACGLIR